MEEYPATNRAQRSALHARDTKVIRDGGVLERISKVFPHPIFSTGKRSNTGTLAAQYGNNARHSLLVPRNNHFPSSFNRLNESREVRFYFINAGIHTR